MNARLRYTGNDPQLMDDSAELALDDRVAAELPRMLKGLLHTVDHLHFWSDAEPIPKPIILAMLAGDDCEAGRMLKAHLITLASSDSAKDRLRTELRAKFESETDYEGND